MLWVRKHVVISLLAFKNISDNTDNNLSFFSIPNIFGHWTFVDTPRDAEVLWKTENAGSPKV